MIFIAPAYSRVRYRGPNFRAFVRPSVRQSVRQHLRRSPTFTSKFGIICISDKVTSKFGFLCIIDSRKCEVLHCNCP